MIELAAFLVTIAAGYLADVVFAAWNWPDVGAIFAIAAMGSFLLWAVRHPKGQDNSRGPDG